MTAAERGVLLLCCALGQSDVRPLTMPQFRTLSRRVYAQTDRNPNEGQELSVSDLRALSYPTDEAERIFKLIDRDAVLERYFAAMERKGFTAVTRISATYPPVISCKLGQNAPPALFCCGDVSMLQKKCVSVVGSRELTKQGRAFAEKVGRMIAQEGFVLCSGGARGADRAAQAACLAAGGKVIVFTAERLLDCVPDERILYVSEEGCELPFTSLRALSRNHLIHALGEKVLVAQTDYERGGTWHGSCDNLRHRWTPVFVNDDGSEGSRGLLARGAYPAGDFSSLSELETDQTGFL